MNIKIFVALLIFQMNLALIVQSGEFGTPYAWNSGHYMTTGTGAREVNQYVTFA